MCIRDVTYITLQMNEATHTTIKKNQGNFWEPDSMRKKASFFTVIGTVKPWSYFGVWKTKLTLTFVKIDTEKTVSTVSYII